MSVSEFPSPSLSVPGLFVKKTPLFFIPKPSSSRHSYAQDACCMLHGAWCIIAAQTEEKLIITHSLTPSNSTRSVSRQRVAAQHNDMKRLHLQTSKSPKKLGKRQPLSFFKTCISKMSQMSKSWSQNGFSSALPCNWTWLWLVFSTLLGSPILALWASFVAVN